MMRRVPQLDSGRRAVTIDGKRSILHEKTWRVLRLLVEHAPDVVSRERIVDHVWQSNSLTGDKGLNQAIWNLRVALGDDPRNPDFIRTIPRLGYRWIGPAPERTALARWLLPAGIAASLALLIGASVLDVKPVAARAYLVGTDVHVEFDDGVRGVLRNATNAEIGAPVISNDGREIVVPVYEDNDCRLVIINLSTRDRQDFSECPAVTAAT